MKGMTMEKGMLVGGSTLTGGAIRKAKPRRIVSFVHAISPGKLDKFIDTFNKYIQLTSDPLIISTMRLWSYLQNLSKAKNLYRSGARLRIWERLFQSRLNEFINNMRILARKRADGETTTNPAMGGTTNPAPPIHPLLAINLAHEMTAPNEVERVEAPEAADLNDLMDRTREEMEADLSTATAVEGENGNDDEDDDIFELAREEAPEPPPNRPEPPIAVTVPARAATPPPAGEERPPKHSPMKTRAGRLAGRKKPDDLEEYLRSNPKVQIEPNGRVLVEGQPLQRYVEELNMMFSRRYEEFTTDAILNNARYRPLLNLFATDPSFNDKFIGNRLLREKVVELRNIFNKERMTAPKKLQKAPTPTAPVAPPAVKKRAASTSVALADPHAGIKTRPPIAARKPPVPPAPSKTTRRAASNVGPQKAGGKSNVQPWINDYP